ncbi:MAG TPA: AraC family transcriptional regulator [Candidatus Angelobacter sp.]|nr:AraC family transcriptional regulator [Candidatus Angelobacter sp.]
MGYPVMRDATLRSHCELVQRVIAAMQNQLDRPMTLQELARIGFASPWHFNRTFRQITGVPPLQFFYALRLDAAKRMLTDTQKKVIDICYEVGYQSVGTFTRRFADVLGHSPMQFRKLTRGRTRPTAYLQPNAQEHRRTRPGVSLSGVVTSPAHFHGHVAVGLFTTRIPQSRPIACTLIKDGGAYRLEKLPEGDFYLFAVGLKDAPSVSVYFDYRNAMRAGGQRIHICQDSFQGVTDLELRPPSAFDPPLLLTLPAQKSWTC